MKVVTPEGYTFVKKFQEDNSHKVLRSVDFFSIKFDEIFFDTVCWVLPRVRNMYDAHSHLDRWAATMRPSEARDKLEGFRYNTVTSYCFQRQWNEARKQEWWPSKSLGPLKQAFGLHPTEDCHLMDKQT